VNLSIVFQHTSFAATSPCNALAVRAYFRDGVLPKPGTICDAEDELFGSGYETASAISARDDLVSTLRELTKRVKVPRLGGGFRT
jgi:Cys-tRNA synthase (O-phospho-L-seryl-tRNA:Cys-tRNA synthase)